MRSPASPLRNPESADSRLPTLVEGSPAGGQVPRLPCRRLRGRPASRFQPPPEVRRVTSSLTQATLFGCPFEGTCSGSCAPPIDPLEWEARGVPQGIPMRSCVDTGLDSAHRDADDPKQVALSGRCATASPSQSGPGRSVGSARAEARGGTGGWSSGGFVLRCCRATRWARRRVSG
jgi:hypothetical protein